MTRLKDIERLFPNEDACKAALVRLRWPNGVRCPRCKAEKVYKLKSRKWAWQCKQCAKNGYRFSPISGSIFENTKYPLTEWFRVIFMMCQSKKGTSALQIHRMLGGKTGGPGSYRTHWYMCHRIRAAMKNDHFKRLTGVVEIDEAYVGGKVTNRPKRDRKRLQKGPFGGKIGIIGAISRKGNVTARVIERMNVNTAGEFVQETVADAVELIATDDHKVYHQMDWGPLRQHESVKHGQGEFVRGVVHTGHIDQFWSLLKRGIVGSYHQVSKQYLPLYVNEFVYRHNHRGDDHIFERVLESC